MSWLLEPGSGLPTAAAGDTTSGRRGAKKPNRKNNDQCMYVCMYVCMYGGLCFYT